MVATLILMLSIVSANSQAVPPDDVTPLENSSCVHPELPLPVCELFYAVKESLDYGVLGKERQPLENLTDYRRVTPELLQRLKQDFIVTSYRRKGNSYELIVTSRADSETRYRATRMIKYRWHDGTWVSLGGYLYF